MYTGGALVGVYSLKNRIAVRSPGRRMEIIIASQIYGDFQTLNCNSLGIIILQTE